MTSTSGIWTPAPSGAAPITASATASSSENSSDSASTITANDFLTLLVTEMKNQDPTATTDPNEYINQLVSVNSLQQLIEMNQNLAAALYLGSAAATSSNSRAASAVDPPDSFTVPHATPAAIMSHLVPLASGNLSMPGNNPAAERLAEALTSHASAH